jgi:hypothetical protein
MVGEKYSGLCCCPLYYFQNITLMLNKDSVLHIPGYVNAWELYLNHVKPAYTLTIQMLSSAQSLMQLCLG